MTVKTSVNAAASLKAQKEVYKKEIDEANHKIKVLENSIDGEIVKRVRNAFSNFSSKANSLESKSDSSSGVGPVILLQKIQDLNRHIEHNRQLIAKMPILILPAQSDGLDVSTGNQQDD